MNIAVAGMGYVGLSLACLLSRHHDVHAVDVLSDKVDLVNRGISPIRDDLIERYLSETPQGLAATLDAESTYARADWVVIATPTNYDSDKNSFDTSSIEAVLDALVTCGSTASVAIKSTVPVGYTQRLAERYPQFDIVFSPEFLREGHALEDSLHPSRIVVGTSRNNASCAKSAREFADLLAEGTDEAVEADRILLIGSTEAEAIKLFSNTYLALRVAFFNELDTFADSRGLDASQIIRGVCLDSRVGDHYNNPSFGYGGYCLPKDSKQLLANYIDIPQDLMGAVVAANATRKEYIAQRVVDSVMDICASSGKDPSDALVGFYRLTMKQGSDNFRESSVWDVMRHIAGKGLHLVVYEPLLADDKVQEIKVVDDLSMFKDMCDIVVANRLNEDLDDISDKVFTRDIFGRD